MTHHFNKNFHSKKSDQAPLMEVSMFYNHLHTLHFYFVGQLSMCGKLARACRFASAHVVIFTCISCKLKKSIKILKIIGLSVM